ncbi:MAG: hypothetical protein QW356_07350 [Candidatus Hadarchaeales archaeon]
MGVSIQYRFLVHHPEVISKLQEWIKMFAQRCNMRIKAHEEAQYLLLIEPPGCETLDLTFRRRNGGWVCEGSCKTQFAGWATHVQVAELLRILAAFCSSAEILDEGGYYETRDIGMLIQTLRWHTDSLRNLRRSLEG